MKKFFIISALCCLTVCFSSSSKTEDDPVDQPKNVYYNPVINYSLPDPSVIKGEDGYFYLYATENIRNLPIHRSKNLVDWEYMGTAFTNDTRPDFEPKGGLWAPDINKIGDKYVLYYSMSVWGGEWTCGIGCATADKPEGPFKDHGKMFRSNEINVQNSIDPFYIEEGGRKYLFGAVSAAFMLSNCQMMDFPSKKVLRPKKWQEQPTKALIFIRRMAITTFLLQ